MASNGQIITYDALRSLGFGSITGTYAGVGASFSQPVRMLKIKNTSDADVYVSFDGITDHDIYPAQSGDINDYGSNRAHPAEKLAQPVGDRVYVKVVSTLPTDGGVFVTVIYASTT